MTVLTASRYSNKLWYPHFRGDNGRALYLRSGWLGFRSWCPPDAEAERQLSSHYQLFRSSLLALAQVPLLLSSVVLLRDELNWANVLLGGQLALFAVIFYVAWWFSRRRTLLASWTPTSSRLGTDLQGVLDDLFWMVRLRHTASLSLLVVGSLTFLFLLV